MEYLKIGNNFQKERYAMDIIIDIVLLVVGFLLLIKGADFFVDGSSNIANKFGIPQLVIGLTIVAMGTSAPEVAVSVSAALKGSAEITMGNVLGSNIVNILLILGLTAMIKEVVVQNSTIVCEIPGLFVITVLVVCLGLMDNKISRVEGVLLLVLMLVYLGYLLVIARKGGVTDDEEPQPKEQEQKMILLLVKVVIGIAMIVVGSDIAVDGATGIAVVLGLSERLIGLTIVAIGTSLPELVTSVTAAIKGNPGIAVGNIVGSNIFNILFVIGITAVITPVVYDASFLTDSIVAILAVILLFICVLRKKKLERVGGILMLVGYIAYLTYIILM